MIMEDSVIPWCILLQVWFNQRRTWLLRSKQGDPWLDLQMDTNAGLAPDTTGTPGIAWTSWWLWGTGGCLLGWWWKGQTLKGQLVYITNIEVVR